jgi:hypothetical protein
MAQQTPVAKKTPAAKQTAAGKVPTKEATATSQAEEEERYRLITEAAYLIAEKRGFEGGRELDDWLQAEAEVDARFAARH